MKYICEQQVEEYRKVQRAQRNARLAARLMQHRSSEELFASLRALYASEAGKEKSLVK